MSVLTQALFGPQGTGPGMTIKLGQIVPPGFSPVDQTIVATYDTKKTPGVRTLAALIKPVSKPPTPPPSPPQPTPAPAGVAAPSYAVSKGGFYLAANTGARILLPPGMPIPPGWTPDVGTPAPTAPVPAAQVPTVAQSVIAQTLPLVGSTTPDQWTPVNTDDPTQPVSTGETYVSGDGKSIVVPKGTPVPADWKPITSVVDLEPMPGGGSSSTTITFPTILKIMGVLGAVGLGYLTYLAVAHPSQARAFLAGFTEFKDLVVDSSQLLIALGIISGIAFVSYEFIGAYQATGSVAGAIGKLTADVIETMVMAVVDALEQLAKDLGSWISDEVSKIGDAINPL